VLRANSHPPHLFPTLFTASLIESPLLYLTAIVFLYPPFTLFTQECTLDKRERLGIRTGRPHCDGDGKACPKSQQFLGQKEWAGWIGNIDGPIVQLDGSPRVVSPSSQRRHWSYRASQMSGKTCSALSVWCINKVEDSGVLLCIALISLTVSCSPLHPALISHVSHHAHIFVAVLHFTHLSLYACFLGGGKKKGYPFGSVDYYADDCDAPGTPLVLLSHLQINVQCLLIRTWVCPRGLCVCVCVCVCVFEEKK